MITAEFWTDGARRTLTMRGHAGAPEAKADLPCAACGARPSDWGNLVCAAASALGQSLLTYLQRDCAGAERLESRAGDGDLRVTCTGGADVAAAFALTAAGLRLLAATYPQSIQIKTREEQ
ncbi:MAG: ribosomal-processing cysteine protease Prp [Oscillospiraceae bacterium]|nr:ribosomal-processing cysteine protease Prp [Oscillospiraceae bacterium]